jgi:hypothetical protein
MFSARVHIGTAVRYIKAGMVRKHCKKWIVSFRHCIGATRATDHSEEPFQPTVTMSRPREDGNGNTGSDEYAKCLHDVDHRLDLLQGRK